ncbi:hypothetical protein [Anaeromyxobacter diazotrophicus]|uniref:Lipoprotein n=1 Tax=Anaeromyxobacter diazotrophicus TaxID=2590199 RepID=A0A7I9VH60_9BACT|nr:hypothetical protein [Anaeromyxobacter diazotrophicus]GEJ55377.1 hypothetical protein AMYX_01180 [Anaeromyxobacter diazotrophicus]
MTKRMAVALASCLALAACGGGSSGNAAAGKTFSYGTASTATSLQTSAVDTQLSSALAVKSAPGADGVQSLGDFAGVTDALLGSSTGVTLASADPAQQQLVAAGRRAALSKALTAVPSSSTSSTSFDNEATCVVATAAKVTLSGCTLTIVDPSASGKVVVDGWAAYDPAAAKLAWDLSLASTLALTSFTPPGSATVKFHESGALAVTDTTFKGEFLADMGMTFSAQGQSASVGVAEALVIDVTYAGTPACVTGGTLEAKRVWTALPQGASGPQYADAAAKITWTGCGSALVALSH